jgi:hypothetical protein
VGSTKGRVAPAARRDIPLRHRVDALEEAAVAALHQMAEVASPPLPQTRERVHAGRVCKSSAELKLRQKSEARAFVKAQFG